MPQNRRKRIPVLMAAKVLIVGTTPDYVYYISKICPERVLFLTDITLRNFAVEPAPSLEEEICSDLSDHAETLSALEKHIQKFALILSGIACFDCESMELASIVADKFNLFFQSQNAIKNSRDKFASKKTWEKAGLSIPRYSLLYSKDDAESFFRKIHGSCVLKPLSGAGSELVFKCNSIEESYNRFSLIREGLTIRQDNRLYNSKMISNDLSILAEEFIEGIEYSCDFIVERSSARIIRLAEKIKLSNLPFGIIAGYKLKHEIPGISHEELNSTLFKAAESACIDKAICMIDFIVKNNKIYLIEISPRPGGDCLPSLLLCASGQNILKMNIDLAEGKEIFIADYREIKELTALRIFAHKNGVLKSIDMSELKEDSSIIELNLTASIGRKIKLPPDDYDSWILGNYIYESEASYSENYRKVANSIRISIE